VACCPDGPPQPRSSAAVGRPAPAAPTLARRVDLPDPAEGPCPSTVSPRAPPGLLELSPRRFLRELGTTTWMRLPGSGDEPARAVVTLLHGDESTGLEALLTVLRRRQRYPFDLHVVVGNVEAALHGSGFAHRFLDGQEDGNRVWERPVPADASPQRRAADAVLDDLLATPLAGLIDLHNTTGANPFHGLVTDDDPASLDLATRFTTTLVRWDLGAGTILEAVAPLAPAAAVECGLPGRHASTAFAVDGLRRFLGPPPGAIPPPDHDLISDLRRVTVRPEVRFRFGGAPDRETDLTLVPDGDASNLRGSPPGTSSATSGRGHRSRSR
jgi:hypothetical protein